MRKCLCLTATAIWLFLVFVVATTQAQSSEPKVEIVGQFTRLRFEQTPSQKNWKSGGGAVIAYSINPTISLEAAFLGFGKGPTIFAGEVEDRPRPEFQGLFGIKAGVQRQKYGVFAKLRPGFTGFSSAPHCIDDHIVSCGSYQKNGFTVDYGGVFEAYPVRRVVLRLDVGAAYTRYPDRRVFIPSEPGSSIPFPGVFRDRDGVSRNLFQLSIGAGFRF
jgi:hypothetical protein